MLFENAKRCVKINRRIIRTVATAMYKRHILDVVKEKREDFIRNVHRRIFAIDDLELAVNAMYHKYYYDYINITGITY